MPKILSVYDFCFFKYTEMWYLMCIYVRALIESPAFPDVNLV